MPLSIHPLVVLAVTLLGAVGVLIYRRREGRRPVTLASIVAPPLGMATGFSMFVFPQTHVPFAWATAALALGATVFAWPLVRTSRLKVSGREVFVERSKAFLWILVGLVAVRYGLREWIEHWLGLVQTGALFFLLAFGMVARWRVQMLLEYRSLRARIDASLDRGPALERAP